MSLCMLTCTFHLYSVVAPASKIVGRLTNTIIVNREAPLVNRSPCKEYLGDGYWKMPKDPLVDNSILSGARSDRRSANKLTDGQSSM